MISEHGHHGSIVQVHKMLPESHAGTKPAFCNSGSRRMAPNRRSVIDRPTKWHRIRVMKLSGMHNRLFWPANSYITPIRCHPALHTITFLQFGAIRLPGCPPSCRPNPTHTQSGPRVPDGTTRAASNCRVASTLEPPLTRRRLYHGGPPQTAGLLPCVGFPLPYAIFSTWHRPSLKGG